MDELAGLPEKIAEALQAIVVRRHAGAAELVRRAGEALLALVEVAGSSVEFPQYLRQAGRRLGAAQPGLAPLFHLANEALLAWEAESTPAGVAMAVRAYLANQEASVGAIAAQAAAGLPGEGVVLTHSHSQIVVEALLLAHRQGARLYVLCTEARPMLEGREAAAILAAEGVRATLLVDAAGPFAVADAATTIWLGAECLAREGLFSKVGSYGLAAAALEAAVPVYVLAGRDTFWPDGRRIRPEIQDRDPLEVWEKPAPGLAVRNRYLDRTPLEWLSGVITAEGVLAPEQLQEQLAALPVHPELV